MVKKASDFDDFLVATILADIFEPSGSDDIDYVSRKIVDGLDAQGMIIKNDFDNEKDFTSKIDIKKDNVTINKYKKKIDDVKNEKIRKSLIELTKVFREK